MRALVHLAAAAFLTSVAAPPAVAQADADTREVQAYRLTMAKLRQLNDMVADLHRQRDADPAYQDLLKKKKELKALSEKDELTEAEEERMARLEEEIAAAEEMEDEGEEQDQSLSAMAARMEADPRISAALKRAGLAAREAATLQLAFFQAAITGEMLDSGTIKEIPKEANTENVRFYMAHKAEIAALTALAEERD
jgi:hypothetical protein